MYFMPPQSRHSILDPLPEDQALSRRSGGAGAPIAPTQMECGGDLVWEMRRLHIPHGALPPSGMRGGPLITGTAQRAQPPPKRTRADNRVISRASEA